MSESLAALFGRYPRLQVCEAELVAALQLLIRTYTSEGKVMVCGNGGSAADAEHIVGELMKSFARPRPLPPAAVDRLRTAGGGSGLLLARQLQGALPAISLVSQISLHSAIANDIGAEMVFAQQVYGLGKPGDVLLGISTSGNSKNVMNALLVAKAFGLKTIGLTGENGGTMGPMVDVAIRVPAGNVAEIQELHLPVYHWLCIAAEAHFFP